MKRALTIAAVLLAFGAAPAWADDASLFQAYDGAQPGDLHSAGQAYLRAARRWNRSHGSRRASKAVIRADRAINRALGPIDDAINAQQPSSANGTDAKRAALAEIDAWKDANRLEMRGLRAWMAGHKRAADRSFTRAGRTMRRRTYPAGQRALAAFKKAGFSSPNRALSQTP